MGNFDDLKLSVEALSGGKRTVILDDLVMPSVMVRIPRFQVGDVIPGGSATTHPAFIVNGVEKNEILISAFQNIVQNNRAYSLPLKDPRVSVNFDQAKTFCENKGPGWHLMTNAEWAAVALWCHKNGTMPRGSNNNLLGDHSAPHEKGVKATTGTDNRILVGSGPNAWNHDLTGSGIADLNGNIWEWVGGMRLDVGEIQVIPDNNAAAHIDQSATSTLWKAIAQNGSLVTPGTAGTLKYDYAAGVLQIDDVINETLSGSRTLETIAADTGITIPEIMKVLGFFAVDAAHGGDNVWVNNAGERLPIRGGGWSHAAIAGVFALDLNILRSIVASVIGFRSAFVI